MTYKHYRKSFGDPGRAGMTRCIEAYGRVLMHMPLEFGWGGSVLQCIDGLFEIAVRACKGHPVNLTPGPL